MTRLDGPARDVYDERYLRGEREREARQDAAEAREERRERLAARREQRESEDPADREARRAEYEKQQAATWAGFAWFDALEESP